MIRRDDGDDWLLISQVDHARLAGECAAVWGNESVPTPPRPEWLVPTVQYHDEGWSDWERSPRIDPDTGRPRDFTEMPMQDATAIWTESIACCGLVPTGRLWVSRHFCHLAEQARTSREDIPEDVRAIDRFLDEQRGVQADEARAVAAQIGTEEFVPLADVGLQYLQFFDRVSLWICCAARDKPEEFSVLSSHTVRFAPETATLLRAEPFPLSVDRLELSASARRIPARRLANDAALRAVLSSAPVEQLRWTLVR